MSKLRLAILGSTRGTAMTALIEATKTKTLGASIELVISNRRNALILQRAQQAGLTAVFIDEPEQLLFEQKATLLLRERQIDLIVLIGYMRILTESFVTQWAQRIINVHPSLLPDFAGLRDMLVHEAVLAQGCIFTGCTVHYVTEEVDRGPVLIQKKCKVSAHDTKESLKIRVQTLEGEALIEAISALSSSI